MVPRAIELSAAGPVFELVAARFPAIDGSTHLEMISTY
jgi:hypothetical protein